MPQQYYSTKQAADLIGASAPAIRNYTAAYGDHLSTEATPPPGQPRRLTPEDVRLLAFIYTATTVNNLTHDQVKAALKAGELDSFMWSVEEQEAPQEAQEGPQDASTALIPVERLQAAMTLLEDARRREEASREREETLQDEIARLRQELGEARGELTAYRRLQPKRPKWWVWLFGGSEE